MSVTNKEGPSGWKDDIILQYNGDDVAGITVLPSSER